MEARAPDGTLVVGCLLFSSGGLTTLLVKSVCSTQALGPLVCISCTAITGERYRNNKNNHPLQTRLGKTCTGTSLPLKDRAHKLLPGRILLPRPINDRKPSIRGTQPSTTVRCFLLRARHAPTLRFKEQAAGGWTRIVCRHQEHHLQLVALLFCRRACGSQFVLRVCSNAGIHG